MESSQNALTLLPQISGSGLYICFYIHLPGTRGGGLGGGGGLFCLFVWEFRSLYVARELPAIELVAVV